MVDQMYSDRYQLERLIARGGMAEVYLARDQRLDRPVAVKVLSAEFARDPNFVARFRREAQAAANLNHPNLVSIFDWGQEGGTYFIVMEYVEGASLKDRLRDEGPLDPEEAARIGADIAAALAYAHRNGVVHRDVKPANVLLTTEGQVKVADLGIALGTDAGEALTQAGSVMGTATYFSPEQAQGKTVDGRSDIYSLGVVLYEMVTGTPPFTGENPVSVAYMHVREQLVPPSHVVEDLPPDFERILLTMLAKDPPLRYSSAEDVRADLLRFQRGQSLHGAAVTAVVAGIDDSMAATAANPALAETTLSEPLPPEGPPKRSRRRAAAIAAGVAALAVLAVVLFVLLTADRNDTTVQVEVPGVVGEQFDDARTLLQAQGFEVERIDVEADEPADTVVGQDPIEGTEVDEGATVELRVSEGIPEVEVPDVAGMTYTDAANEVRRAGLVPQRVDEPSDDVEEGRVIRTEPGPNQPVARDSSVDIVVSTGPEAIEIPPVAGMSAAEAANLLGQLGFQTIVTDEESESMPPGEVIRTDPPEGTTAQRDSTVEIFVSSGPGEVEVPDVVGAGQNAAVSALQAQGFVPNVVPVPSSAANQGRVITQSPSAGSTAERGSAVTITVGQGPGQS